MTKLQGKIVQESEPETASSGKRLSRIVTFIVVLLILGAIWAAYFGMGLW